MDRQVVNLARRPSSLVQEIIADAILGNVNGAAEGIAHYSILNGKALPYLNIFSSESSVISENTTLKRPLIIIVGGAWEGKMNMQSDREYIKSHTKRIFSGMFSNHNEFKPAPDVFDSTEITPSRESRFPSIKNRMRQGKYNSIILFNASNEETPRFLSDYPLCNGGEYKLSHLLDEVYGSGNSSKDDDVILVAFIDSALTKIEERLLDRLVQENQNHYPNVNLIFPFAYKDEINFEYEYGAITLFLENLTSGMDDVASLNEAQSEMASRTKKYYNAQEKIAAIRNSSFLYYQNVKLRNNLGASASSSMPLKPRYSAFPEIDELVANNPQGLSEGDCNKIRKHTHKILFSGMEFYNRCSSQEDFAFHAELFSIAVAVSQYSKQIDTPIPKNNLKDLYKQYLSEPMVFTKTLFPPRYTEPKMYRSFSEVRKSENSNDFSKLSRDYLRILSSNVRPDMPFREFDRWLAKLETIQDNSGVNQDFQHVEGVKAHCSLILDHEFSNWFAQMAYKFNKGHTQDVPTPSVNVKPDLWFRREIPYLMLPETVSEELKPLEEIRKRWCRLWKDQEAPFQNVRSFDLRVHSPWSRSLKDLLDKLKGGGDGQ